MEAETTDRAPSSEDPGRPASGTVFVVAPPYDVLGASPAWQAVFESIGRNVRSALSADDRRHAHTRAETESLGRPVLSAVVGEVIEPQPVATLLALHRGAVAQQLLPEVAGEDVLVPEIPLLEARRSSSPALLAVEAGVYGIVGDIVRAALSPPA